MKTALSILTLILAALLVAWVAFLSTETTEINAMTGAKRTKVRRALVFETPWTEKSTWVAASAERQGISTAAGWQSLGKISDSLIWGSRGCAKAPAAYDLGSFNPQILGLESVVEIDHFVRNFVAASESKRKIMLKKALH